jgi:hypothetical protein
MVPAAHAQGYPTGPGTVCLYDASDLLPTLDPCPSAPFVFNGPYPSTPQMAPTQIRVGVYVNGSAGLDGFNVILVANDSLLRPAGVDLNGTVLLGTPEVIAECLSGVLVMGPACSGADTINALDLSAVSANGEPDTVPPTTGLLFTAIYNITGTAPSGGIPIGFQTSSQFCSTTSVPGNVCVTIANGSGTPNPETVQTGNTFDNSACLSECDWYATTPNVTSITLNQGATVGNHVMINATFAQGPTFYPPVVGTSYVTFSSAVTPGFGVPLFAGSTTSECSTFTGTPLMCSVVATLSTSIGGNYTVTIYGLYHGDDCGPNGACSVTYTLVGVVNIRVSIRSLGWTVNGVVATTNPQTNYYAKGTQSLVDVFTSQSGYSGTITLAQSVCNAGSTGVACPLALPPAFAISAGQTITKLINFTATGEGNLLYRDTMTGTSLPVVTEGVDTIHISGFSLTPNATSIFTTGSSHDLTVTVKSLGNTGSGFAGPVALSSTSDPQGLNVSFSMTSVTLTSGGSQGLLVNFTSASPGTYTVYITGTGGTDNMISNQTAALTVGISSIPFQVRTTFMGVNATINGTLGIYAATKTLAGTTVLTVVNATTGALIFLKTANVTMHINTLGTSSTSHFVEDIPTSPLWLATSCDVNVNATSVSCFLSRTPDVFHSGSVGLNEVTYVGIHFNTSDALANLSGTGYVNVSDCTIMIAYFRAAVFLP